MNHDEDEEEDQWMPEGSFLRKAFILGYALACVSVVMLGPLAIAVWLGAGESDGVKALCWSAGGCWLVFYQTWMSSLMSPIGRLVVPRFAVLWPLNRAFGKMPMKEARLQFQADFQRVLEARRRESERQARSKPTPPGHD